MGEGDGEISAFKSSLARYVFTTFQGTRALCTRHNALWVTCASGSMCRDMGEGLAGQTRDTQTKESHFIRVKRDENPRYMALNKTVTCTCTLDCESDTNGLKCFCHSLCLLLAFL